MEKNWPVQKLPSGQGGILCGIDIPFVQRDIQGNPS
jgi:hypothetical protein